MARKLLKVDAAEPIPVPPVVMPYEDFVRLVQALAGARPWVNGMQRELEKGGKLDTTGPAARALAKLWGAVDAIEAAGK